MRKPITEVACGAILIALLVPGAALGQVISYDLGITERSWLFRSLPGIDPVIFAWIPEHSVFDAELFLIGECYRENDLGEPVGRHRVVFKKILLVGVDSGNEVGAVRVSKRIRDGIQKEQAVWYLTDAARALFPEDSAILVSGEIKVGKRVDPWDILVCGLGVMEMLDVEGLAVAAGSAGFDGGPLTAVEGVDLPRLLRVPARTE